MVEQELVNYIKEQLKSGHDEESIRKHLIGYGYEIRDIDDAIGIAKGNSETPDYNPVAKKEIKKKPPKPKSKIKKHDAKKEKPAKTKEMGNIFLNIFMNWFSSLYKPGQIFRAKKGKVNISSGIMRTLSLGAVAGLIVSLHTFMRLLIGSYSIGQLTFTTVDSLKYAFTSVSSFVEIPITMFIGWLALSGIVYAFSIMMGGKGTFSEFSGMISIFVAPVMMLSVVLSAFLPASIMIFVFLILIILSIYPLIKALEIVHNFSMFEAVITFAVPMVVLILLLVPLYSNIFSALYSLFVG
ncbi:MAG: Yip1 family protein [Candidatus Undinarchaeales archaeon]